MVGIAIWHFAVLVPDRFWGGIVGAFVVAVPGAPAALAPAYWYGSRVEARRDGRPT